MAGKYTDTHPQFTVFEPTTGSFAPAADGEIEFFEVGTTGSGNRKDTFSDPDLTVVNPNPIDLDGFGRSINPIFLDGTYNTVIRDFEGNQLDQVDNVSGPSDSEGVPSVDVDFFADLRAVDTLVFQSAYIQGTTALRDGGQGKFIYDEDSTESDNGVDVAEPDVGGGRWLLDNNKHNSIYSQDASGTVDAFSITPTPPVSVNDSSRVFFVRSLGPNTLTDPSNVEVTIGSSTTLNLRLDDSAFPAVGDTGPVGYEMILKVRSNDTAITLLNPYMVGTDNYVPDSVDQAAMGLLSVGNPELINNSVGVTKLEDMSAATFLGQILGGSGDPVKMTAAQAKTALQIASGDVSGLGALAVLNTVSTGVTNNDAMTNAKLANMVTQTFKGRNTAGTGDPEDLSVATVQGMLGIVGLGALAFLDSVDQATIDADSVGQSEIKTDTQVQGTLINNGGTNEVIVNSIVSTGGAYLLGLQTQMTLLTTDNVWFALGGATTGTYGPAFQISMCSFSQSSGNCQGNWNSTFIDASPPYNLNGEGDISLFIYIKEDKDGNITGTSISGTPPWVYNGPTNAAASRVVGNPEGPIGSLRKYNMQPEEIILPPWRGGDLDKWLEGPKMVEVEIDHGIKNADIDLFPHPFITMEEGDKVYIIEPCSSICDQLREVRDRGEDITRLFTDGYIDYSESCNSFAPKGVESRKAKWKLS